MRFLYSTIAYLLTPVLLLHFGVRGLSDRDWWKRWSERFGSFHAPLNARGIVVHAASVGEVNAAAPLIRSIQLRWPDYPLTVTCFTPTGSARIRALFGDSVHHVYIPIDLPGATRRFLKDLDPRLIVVMETEIWPNLYQQAQRLKMPLLISNARLTQKSSRGWSRVAGLARVALRCARLIATQTEDDRKRFVALGADPDTTRVFGNLKFDIDLPSDAVAQRNKLRQQWGAGRTVMVAGSTHATDEDALFATFQGILEHDPDTLLIIAARYPERFERVAEAARNLNIRLTKLSEGDATAETQCLVIDRMGVLLDYYAAADIAFVGGTLAQVGGHNPLEAAALGKPLILGPNTGHIEQLTRKLLDAGAAIQISHSDQLPEAWLELQTSADKREKMGRAARLLVEQERGALAKNLEAIRALLTES